MAPQNATSYVLVLCDCPANKDPLLRRAGEGRESSCNVGAAWLIFGGPAVDVLPLALRQLKATVFFSGQDAKKVPKESLGELCLLNKLSQELWSEINKQGERIVFLKTFKCVFSGLGFCLQSA